MRSPRSVSGISAGGSGEATAGIANPAAQSSAAAPSSGKNAERHEQAALGPIPQPVSAAENPAPALLEDSPAEARGRRTLSTAFVMVGPDGHLTVELNDGRVLVLRDVVMRRKHYDGVQVLGDAPGAKYHGGYADVAAARPGGAPAPDKPDLAASNPVGRARSPAKLK